MRSDAWLRCPACDGVVKVPNEDQISIPLFVASCSHCGLEFDWRLTRSKDHLRGAVLYRETFFRADYSAPNTIWDHEHCAMCWLTFMEEDLPAVERAGFVVYQFGQEWWICRDCFDCLAEEMDWSIDTSEEPPD